jgi:hypothetical protein
VRTSWIADTVPWLARVWLCATVALVAVGVHVPTISRAHDPRAPPGAEHNWLPHREWVRFHWVPFDEADLHRALSIDGQAVYHWLSDDHRTLAQLALRRGLDPDALVEELVAPHGSAPILRRRAHRVLTQGHLAQHLFFHVFHGPRVPQHSWRILGVSPAVFVRLRQRGLTPIQIARRGHRSAHQLRIDVVDELRHEARLGAARRVTSKAQSRVMLGRQTRLLGCWMHKPLAKFDRDSPYGDPLGGHGPHERDSHAGPVNVKKAAGCWLPITR